MNYIWRQNIYKSLPVALPLLAGLLCLAVWLLAPADGRRALLWGLIPAALIGLAISVLFKVEKHQDAAPSEAFLSSMLGGIASWWLPSVLFLVPFQYFFLAYRRALDARTVSASVMGFAVVALYAGLAIWQAWIPVSWYPFFRFSDLWTMVPTVLLLAVVFVLTNVQPDRRGH